MVEATDEGAGRAALDHVVPEVADSGGYRIRHRDLRFLRITVDDLEAMRRQERPLGISNLEFAGLLRELRSALLRDGIALDSCAVRLKGSAANLFSGPHKPMPTDRSAVGDLMADERAAQMPRGLFPTDWEIDNSWLRLRDDWIDDGDWPTQRPFDAMHRVRVALEPSDIDLQISSDAMVNRCEEVLRDAGLPVTESRFVHPVYNFIRKDLVESAAPFLFRATRRLGEYFGRNVSVAVFPSAGPPDVSDRWPELSAHHKPDDWLIDLAPDARPEPLLEQ